MQQLQLLQAAVPPWQTKASLQLAVVEARDVEANARYLYGLIAHARTQLQRHVGSSTCFPHLSNHRQEEPPAVQLSLLPHVGRTLRFPLFFIQSKFAPTVPSQRRRRPDEAGPSSGAATTAAEAAAANEAFQDLIRAAQTESKWMRGRGRGFGRGRGGAATQVSHTTLHPTCFTQSSPAICP